LRRLFKGALALCVCAALASCGAAGRAPRGGEDGAQKKDRSRERASAGESRAAGYGEPETLGRLDDDSLDESSGLAASRLNPGVVWTHNDSGDKPLVYAFDARGRGRGVWQVTGARLHDWEDIATGPGPETGRSYLYVGDIGDNKFARREIIVYRFPEPEVSDATAESGRRRPLATEAAEAIRLRYPERAHDAEALLVHPRTGDLYVVTKVLGGPAGVYKLPVPFAAGAVNTLTKVGEFTPPTLAGGLVTGGDIAPDGRRLVLCDYANGYELRLPRGATDFDAIWRQPPTKFSLGRREQGEGVAYAADGAAVFAASEGKRPPLVRVAVPR
jgi:hypothetical protein